MSYVLLVLPTPNLAVVGSIDLHRGGEFRYPEKTRDVHHVVELVVTLDGGGSDFDLSQAARQCTDKLSGLI